MFLSRIYREIDHSAWENGSLELSQTAVKKFIDDSTRETSGT
jgi:ssDNA-specific exonuclease RecJ